MGNQNTIEYDCFVKTRNVLLTVLEAEKTRRKAQLSQCVERLALCFQMVPSRRAPTVVTMGAGVWRWGQGW